MAVNYDGGSIGSFGLLAGIQRPNFSFSYVDDFFHANDEDWTLKQIAGSGTFARIDGHGGVALIDNAADTANHASQLGMKGIVDLSQGDAAFEASVRVSSDGSTSTLSTSGDGTGLIVGLAVDSDDVDAFAASGNVVRLSTRLRDTAKPRNRINAMTVMYVNASPTLPPNTVSVPPPPAPPKADARPPPCGL